MRTRDNDAAADEAAARAPCPLCSGEASFRLTSHAHRILRCTACDFEFVHPLPSAQEIARVYESNYFQGEGFGYADYSARERRANERKAEIRVGHLERLGLRPGMRLLDIGCADGVFMRVAAERGLDAWGVEVSPEALALIPEALRERVLPTLEQAKGHGPFDAVTLWDVLEHVPDPVATLKDIRGVLTTGGIVGVALPVIDNANARLRPHTWDQYKPPEHLSYFSRRSLCSLLEREVGPVVHEEPAWHRYGRLFEVARPAGNPLTRGLKHLERGVARLLVAAHLVDKRHFVDSVLVFARTQQQG
jgi:SAM-dependent methyltransferase